MLLTNRADLIFATDNFRLVKLDFAIFGLKISPKSSGNRCILFIDGNTKVVRILLVYSKNDLPAHHETAEWKNLVKSQYSDVAGIFNL